jgi:simple sugar transport system permease protein
MSKRLRRTLEGISIPIIAVILGLVVASLFILFAGVDPIQTYENLFCEGFGTPTCKTFGDLFVQQVQKEDGTTETVFAPFYGDGGHQLSLVAEQATPLILTALAAIVAFKAGIFSIGMDGQFTLGAITAVTLGRVVPGFIWTATGLTEKTATEPMLTIMHLTMPLIAILGAMVVGAFYSWIAGYLKVKLNVNELISTIVLNGIAVQLATWLVSGPLRTTDPNAQPRTLPIDNTAFMTPFSRGIFADIDWFSGSRVGLGFVIAVIAAIAVGIYLWRTTAGYEQRMSRGTGLFARFSGVPVSKAVLRAMLISGALSGLAGALQMLGVERRFILEYSAVGYGFEGVLVAILAKESIIGILIVAPLFAGLNNGSTNLQFGNLPQQLGGIIISFIILFASMEDFLRSRVTAISNRVRPHRPTVEQPSGATP